MFLFSILCISVFQAFSGNFVEENIKTFHEFKLSNDIPVVVKIAKPSTTKSIVILIKGGATDVPVEKAGLNSIAISTALFESKKYPNTEKRKILKNTSAGISMSVGMTETTYMLSTLNQYFDEVFDLYVDLLLNPALTKSAFDEITTNYRNDYRHRLSDGSSRANEAIGNAFFKNHPYAGNRFNLKTLDNITLKDVEEYFQKFLINSKLVIFAVGDFEPDKLKVTLEKAFGGIKKGKYKQIKVPQFDSKRELPLQLDPFSDLKNDTTYVRCNMFAPNFKSKDYYALSIAHEVFRALGFDIIRTERSAVYSFITGMKSEEANYSYLAGFRTNNIWNFKKATDDTLKKLIQGYSAMKDSNGKYKKLSETIDFYKASFQTSYYEGLQTSVDIAASMASSYILAGNYKYYLTVLDKLNKVTTNDIINAAKKYLLEPKKSCAISASPETIEQIKKNNPYTKKYEVIRF